MDDSALLIVLLVIIVLTIGAFIARLRRRESSKSEDEIHIFESQPVAASIPIAHEPARLADFLPPQFVVLDLETTGLKPETDEIIEIGAIRVTLAAQNHLVFQTLVRPVRRIPPKVTEITGITQKMVESDGLPLKDALRQFKNFVGELPVVTFNAEFDMAFLHNAAKRHEVTFSNSYTCALKRARRAWPGLPSYRLADLAKMGNLSDADTHRAISDCTRALIVFTSATSTLRQKVRWTKPTADS